MEKEYINPQAMEDEEVSYPEHAPIQNYLEAMQEQQEDPRQYASNTIVAGGEDQNLVQWQLELDSILERIEHMLRGDKPKFINGSLIFSPPTSNEERIFTEFGIGEIMRILSMYLNRNTILSNYDEDTINWKVYDFGKEVSDQIYLKYEVMFATMTMEDCFRKVFDTNAKLIKVSEKEWIYEKEHPDGSKNLIQLTPEELALVLKEYRTQKLEKRKLYPMIVRQLVDIVHSAYLRALNGGERLSLHEARSVHQNETFIPGVNVNLQGQGIRQRSPLNPMRYIKGKYV